MEEMATGSGVMVAHARRILGEAARCDAILRVAGGVAIAMRSEAAGRPPFARSYSDIDFVGRSRESRMIEDALRAAGLVPDDELNALYGAERLCFESSDVHVDVFLNEIRACHNLELEDRLAVNEETLAPADLLLSKLQIVETTRKDRLDILALLVDLPLTDDDDGVNTDRITRLCGRNWGWYRTVTGVARSTIDFGHCLAADNTEVSTATDRLAELLEAIEGAQKSRAWKVRARIGDRAAWYEAPEDMRR